MRYYATVGPMKMITKGDSCGLFRSKKHAMTPDEARSFFYNSEGPVNFLVFLFENAKDAKIAAAHSAANLCNISEENKFLKHKAYTAPVFIVEVPDFLITKEWQTSSVKFTTDVEKKVASYFGVKDLGAEKTFKYYPCSKDAIINIYHAGIFHPYFRHKDIDMESAESKQDKIEQYNAVMMRP